MKKRLFWITLFLFFLGTIPAFAQEPTPRLPPPIPPIWNLQGLEIRYQRVDVAIADQVATTRIDQLFVNNSDGLLEGTYLFPLPPGASVGELTMWVDGEPIEAKVLQAEEARDIYDTIVRQLRDPALLEYVGTDAIQANVFPIPPRDERRIEIEYTQVLPADNGLIRFIYPQATDLYTDVPLGSQSIRVELASDQAIRTIYSPSHPVAIDRSGEFEAIVGYEASDVTPAGDFELYYSVAAEMIGLNLLSYKEGNEDGFFLLLAAPSIVVDRDAILARDVVIVLDTSGSMEGEKLSQAQGAARYVIDHLNPEDRFNVVAFSTSVRSFTPDLAPAADADEAFDFIDSLEALGGTNISMALLETMRQADPERPLTVLFLTDGLATEGIVETPLLLNAVQEAAPAQVRLFAFGVGNDVDTFLLDSLAADHGGTTTYVRPGQPIDETVSAFYAKVSTPVLANVTLDVDGVRVDRIYPTTLPDLFAGTQLVLTGRYREGGEATITLSGTVNGEVKSYVFEGNSFRRSGGQAFIPRLWATRAVGHLLQEIRLHGESEELVQSVIDLSIRYGVITPYTSFLIEEDDIFTQTGRDIIVEESMERAAEPAPVSGEEAVADAAAEGALAAAEAPLPAATMTAGAGSGNAVTAPLQSVGNKTFVYRDGVWIDTQYSEERYEVDRVAFAGDTYFELLNAAPELGRYLALGPRVLVVFGERAYEIVEEGGDATVDLPVASESGPDAAIDGPGVDATSDPSSTTGPAAPRQGICAAAWLAPLFLTMLLLSPKLKRRRR